MFVSGFVLFATPRRRRRRRRARSLFCVNWSDMRLRRSRHWRRRRRATRPGIGPAPDALACNSGLTKKNPVLHDRAAEREAVLLSAGNRSRAGTARCAGGPGCGSRQVGRAVELVRAALRDRVDREAGEVALTRTSNGASSTWYSFTDSSPIDFRGLTARLARGAETEDVASRLAPSIWMLLKRLFTPPADRPGRLVDTCGVSEHEVGEVAVERRQSTQRGVRRCPFARRGATARSGCSRIRRRAHRHRRRAAPPASCSLKFARKFWPSDRRTPVALSGAKPMRRTVIT